MKLRRVVMALTAALAAAACNRHRPAPMPSPLSATPQMIDSMWTVAMDFYHRGKWSQAGVAFDRVELEMSPGDARVLLGRLYLGDTYVHQGSELEAVQQFRRLSDEFPADSLAQVALLHAGDAYLRLWRKPDLDPTYGTDAESTYEEVLTRYPSSPAADSARLRLTEVENRFAERQYREAKFYLKYNAFDSAILYFKDLVATWPTSPVAPKAVDGLIEAYHKLAYHDDVRDMCGYYRAHWPNAKVNSNCPSGPAPTAPGR